MLQKNRKKTQLKTNYFVVGLFLFLVASAIALHFITQTTNVVEAQNVIRQAAGPAVEGQWQPSSGADYQLWRFRKDSGTITIPVNNRIDDYPFGANHYPLYQCTKYNSITDQYYQTTCEVEPNQSPLANNLSVQNIPRNNINTYFNTGWTDRIRDQKPYLVIGHDGTGPGTPSYTTIGHDYYQKGPGEGGGFYGPELSLDLWVPRSFDISTLAFTEEEFCYNASYSAWDSNGSSRDDQIYIEGRSGQQLLLSNAGNACSSGFAQPNLGQIGNPVDVKNLFIAGNSQYYKNYKIIIKTNVISAYVNQFRLKIANPTNSYLLITETQTQDARFSAIQEGANAMGISNRLPEAYRRLEILWEASINIASPPDSGCHGSDDLEVGIYDHDYNLSQTNWIGLNELAPTIEIFETDRWAYSANPNNASFSLVKTYKNHDGSKETAVASNAWDTVEYDFKYDKVYKIRFSNIAQRSWIQIGVPYDQINALQNCVYAPLVKVFYSDISAGGRFGLGETSDACRYQNDVDLEQGVYAGLYGNIRGRYPGSIKDSSSAEYGVRVRDQILGFYSNFKPTAVPSTPTYSTFANTTSYYGGNFGKSRCIPNYWRGASNLNFVPTDTLDIGTIPGPTTIAHKPDTQPYVTLTNNNPDLDLKATIYIEGDLLIANNIVNNSTSTWNNFNDIGYITIIVKGDILINPNVSQIDAVLIAYPDSGNNSQDIEDDTKGRIYTCYLATDNVTDNPLYDLDRKIDPFLSDQDNDILIGNSVFYNRRCSAKRLIVNGALIAREIHLGRTFIEKRDAIGSYVSEEINLLPEYFIGTPNLPGFEDWLHRSDSIHILPVNF